MSKRRAQGSANRKTVVRVDECPRIRECLLGYRGLWAAEKQGKRAQRRPSERAKLECLLALTGSLADEGRYRVVDFTREFMPTVVSEAHNRVLSILNEANPNAVHVS